MRKIVRLKLRAATSQLDLDVIEVNGMLLSQPRALTAFMHHELGLREGDVFDAELAVEVNEGTKPNTL